MPRKAYRLINAKLISTTIIKFTRGNVLLKFQASSVKAIGTERTEAPIIN